MMFVVTSEPCAVKMAPLIAETERYGMALQPLVVVAGPDPAAIHRSLRLFGIGSAYDLQLGADRYRRSDRAVPQIWQALSGFCAEHQVAAVVTLGSDAVAAGAMLAAGFAGIPAARIVPPRPVSLPDPGERGPAARVALALASAHFCASAADHAWLVGCGVDYRAAWVTGNPLADGLADVARQVEAASVRQALGLERVGPYVLVAIERLTVGPELVALGRGLRSLAAGFEGEVVVFAQGERSAQRLLSGMLGGTPGLRLLGRPDYPVLVSLIAGAMAVVSDAPAVQEVARLLSLPFAGVRLEPSAAASPLDAPDAALQRLDEALSDPLRLRDLILPRNPLDDGRAAARIVRVLHRLAVERSAA